AGPDLAAPLEHEGLHGCLGLLFLGRMDFLKGGSVLIEALPETARRLGRPLRLALAGDGPERKKWEQASARITAAHPSIAIEFLGWVNKERLGRLYSESNLLVIPSLWPEPFGRIGLEAGRYGLPAAAFAAGGITDWLVEGVNGYLAPADRPT